MVRIELFGDEDEAIRYVIPPPGILQSLGDVTSFRPNTRYTQRPTGGASAAYPEELKQRLDVLNSQGQLVLEAQRLEQRTALRPGDAQEGGHCNGVENYARPAAASGKTPPNCLIDYYPR